MTTADSTRITAAFAAAAGVCGVEGLGVSESELKLATEKIMQILLALHWTARRQVFTEVRFNDVFCTSCGYGSPEDPNPGCQCENDE